MRYQLSLPAPLLCQDERTEILRGLATPPGVRGTPLPPPSEAELLRRAVLGIPAREAEVVRRYYGLCGSTPQALTEIGAAMGISRERARQVKVAALRRLRDSGFTGAIEAEE